MRQSELKRKTKETDIFISINLDGNGVYSIDTGIPFFNHMLEAFSKHSGFDLQVKVKGDIEVDFHHTIEDTGIVLGEVFNKSLTNKKGVARFGEATLPLDEALSRVVLDLSGRTFFYFGVIFNRTDDGNNINPYIFEEFFRSFADSAKINLHIDSIRGNNSHHILESIFKAFAKALSKAIEIKGDEIPSTKGII
jgi:imidazoleglycerol-phosphate dehydratase